MKKIVKNGLLLLILIVVVYSIVCIIMTHDIVVETERVVKGEEVVLDIKDPFYKISYKERCFPEVENIQGRVWRIFTWCGRKRGCIYILYWKKYIDAEGNVIYIMVP